jgi:ABC-type cobalamin/Fe3+-siderophores transport system ATPase subunit
MEVLHYSAKGKKMAVNLKFQTGYKSLTSLDDIELPDFTVITGLNGSGKSQLLESILQNNSGVRILDDAKELTQKKHVTHTNLVPNNTGAIDTNQIRQSSQNILNQFNQYKHKKRTNHVTQIQQVIKDEKQRRLITTIAQEAGKPLDDLNEEDFYRHYPIDDGLTVNDVFQQSFSLLFKRYHTKFEDNLVDEFRFERYGEGTFLSRDDFISKYGPPPWDLVNRILETSQVNYKINSPEGTFRDAPFTLRLENRITGVEVNFQDLSSGEKVLVSLALSLYNLNVQVDFPQVLLMDEPDAPLHPSMTKHFLNVLQDVFVKEKNVKVIMTTHSPSTIALSQEDSIYVMNSQSPRLRKASKDEALSVLTSGVPTLSVNYENRRQVFVESKYDQIFYEQIYSKSCQLNPSHISLDFLCSSNDGSAGCEQVKEIVSKLSGFGNHQIFGIIDWDNKNSGTSKVKVIGEDVRYSVENYILDPLILAIYLIREAFVNKEEFGLKNTENFFDVRDFSSD